MSDSLSSADRDARIAAPVSEDRALVDAYGESVEQAMIASTRSGATYKKYAAARGRCRDELVSALCSRAREIEELRAELRAERWRSELAATRGVPQVEVFFECEKCGRVLDGRVGDSCNRCPQGKLQRMVRYPAAPPILCLFEGDDGYYCTGEYGHVGAHSYPNGHE